MLKNPKAQKILEKELAISRIIRFMAWFFIVIILLDVVFIFLDAFSKDINPLKNLSNFTISIALISGVGAGFSFTISEQINENKSKKISLFNELMICMFVLGIIAVIVVGFYPPVPF